MLLDGCEFDNVRATGSSLSVKLSESVTECSPLALCIVLPSRFKQNTAPSCSAAHSFPACEQLSHSHRNTDSYLKFLSCLCHCLHVFTTEALRGDILPHLHYVCYCPCSARIHFHPHTHTHTQIAANSCMSVCNQPRSTHHFQSCMLWKKC